MGLSLTRIEMGLSLTDIEMRLNLTEIEMGLIRTRMSKFDLYGNRCIRACGSLFVLMVIEIIQDGDLNVSGLISRFGDERVLSLVRRQKYCLWLPQH